MYGSGLNSIRIRFTLLVGVVVAINSSWQVFHFQPTSDGALSHGLLIAGILAQALVPAIITYVAAGKLTGLISELRRSTEAIAAGDFDAAINVNCACEVGGLADSFRTMVAKLNSNILRMNVLAHSDPVTGLPNRAVITHVLSMATRGGRQEPSTGTLMFIDLDKFKQVNDTLGHDAGDELLRQASKRILSQGLGRTHVTIDNCMTSFGELSERAPKDFVFARFAGDEFVAFLPGITSRDVVEAYANKIISALSESFRIGNTDVTISASIGIASTPDDTTDPAELLNFADLAMYESKQSGRGRYVFFNGTLRESAIQRVNIERELRSAIPRGEIFAVYQPKVDCSSLDIVGVEALARWNHPVRGILSPREFIDVAEQSSLIDELGNSVLRQSMEQCAQWNRDGRPTKVSINVSQLQFTKLGLFEELLELLAQTSAPAHLIEIEITESAALIDPSRTTSILDRCRAEGLSVAIDDFGCGFSNLSLLSRLPFDTLKVDRSLVESIGLDERAESVIKAIVHMGHSLGHSIVAEGVENLKQLAFLQHLGCDAVQGFLFARPMSATSFTAWEAGRALSPIADQIARAEKRLLAS